MKSSVSGLSALWVHDLLTDCGSKVMAMEYGDVKDENDDCFGIGMAEEVTAYRPDAFAGSMAPKEVDERFSCTNTNFGGEDPAKEQTWDEAVFEL